MENLNKYDYTTTIKTETLTTGRTYFTPDGDYASITTLLGKTADKAWLQAWIDKVGEEEARRVSKEATDRGTLVHEIAENYFNGEDVTKEITKQELVTAQMTRNLIKAVSTGVEEIWGQEAVLWSKKLKYAGRSDMIGVWKGKPSIIDFKTSRRKKYVKQIKDYFLQGTAYAFAHNEMYGTNIRNLAIVITVENGEPQIFETSAVHHFSDLQNRIKQYHKMKKEGVI
jgi:genome maintenance exonuclease 1